MAITLQRINPSPSYLVLGRGFRGRRTKRHHFRLDQIQDGGRRLLKKLQMAKSLKRIIQCTVCMYTDHTIPLDSNLSTMTQILNLFHTGGSLADLRYKEKERKGQS